MAFTLVEGLMVLTLVTSVAVIELQIYQRFHHQEEQLKRRNKAANQAKRQALERWAVFVKNSDHNQ
ncbi:type II secretion system protein [Fructobacillus ficulneus]|uniref:Uncharacterized protein n=1 Tax=Fructobacillus ficulneus TaxID=157463 RepID=A0A0K8MGH9_9LACO|nr:type II secretion system protein [Fructobacillus ficulneus]GAO99567.1 hypothetical protein FFIC_230510 [Fructobacillus ficulneus]